jgi:hypothetical protein
VLIFLLAKHEIRKKGIPDAERAGLFDPSFMDTFTPALPYIQEKGIKIAVNAGASDTEMLAKLVEKTVQEKGLNLRVAWIKGDDVMEVVNKLLKQGEKFENICFGGELKDWGFEPVAAQCYLGGAVSVFLCSHRIIAGAKLYRVLQRLFDKEQVSPCHSYSVLQILNSF